MPNSYFKFKQFTINQDKCAMKVGVDAVILGACTNVENVNTILDIGTGTGLLALMLAQRNQNAQITAIEIDKEASGQAYENCKQSNWANRIEIINASFQEFYKPCKHTFDLIICNPPYFINSQKSPDKQRSIARHNDILPFNELLFGVSKLISKNGRFNMIIPVEIGNEIITEALQNSLYPANILNIKPKKNLPVKRKIIEFCKEIKPIKENGLIIQHESDNNYTTEFKLLTKNYYLNF